MTIPPSADRDPAILDEIRQLTTELSDARVRSILRSVIDAVALNPQPLPPATGDILRSVIDAVALNPQPLPPEPPPEIGAPREI